MSSNDKVPSRTAPSRSKSSHTTSPTNKLRSKRHSLTTEKVPASPARKTSKDKLDSFLEKTDLTLPTDGGGAGGGASGEPIKKRKSKKSSISLADVGNERLPSPTKSRKSSASVMEGSVGTSRLTTRSPSPGKKTSHSRAKKDQLDLFLESKGDQGERVQQIPTSAQSAMDERYKETTEKKKSRKKTASSTSVDGYNPDSVVVEEEILMEAPKQRRKSKSSTTEVRLEDMVKPRGGKKPSSLSAEYASSGDDRSEHTSSSREERKKSRPPKKATTRTKSADWADFDNPKRVPSTIHEESASAGADSPEAKTTKRKGTKSPKRTSRKSSTSSGGSSTLSDGSLSSPHPQQIIEPKRVMHRRMSATMIMGAAPPPPTKTKKKTKTSKKEKRETPQLFRQEDEFEASKKMMPMGRRGSLLIAGLPSGPVLQRSNASLQGAANPEETAAPGSQFLPKPASAEDDIFTYYGWTQQEDYPKELVEKNRAKLRAIIKENPLHNAMANRLLAR